MKSRTMSLVAGFCFAAVSVSIATPQLFVWQDGDNTPYDDWAEVQSVGGVNFNTGGGAGQNVADRTAIQIDATIGTTPPDRHVMQTTDSNLTGNMTSFGANNTVIAGLRFDFYSQAGGPSSQLPSELAVYFVSDSEGIWVYDLTPRLVEGWGTYNASFASSSGWFNFTDTNFDTPGGGTFATALTQVNALGVFALYQTNVSDQQYGIANFGLAVPEPETYMILGMALLSVAIVFRKRISDSLAEARAMLQV